MTSSSISWGTCCKRVTREPCRRHLRGHAAEHGERPPLTGWHDWVVLIDAHAHLDHYEADAIDDAVAEIEADGILTVSVSTDPESYRAAQVVASRSPLILATFGVHPWEAPRWDGRLDEIAALAAESPMAGEIGLDHRWVEDPDSYPAQRTVFAAQLEMAVSGDRIVNVHTAGAESETRRMMVEAGVDRAIVHWYSGPVDELAAMVAAGYFFTVGVEVLVSDRIRQIAAEIPDDRILTETDNPGGWPWLTGENTGPTIVHRVIDELARVRDTTPGRIEALVASNLKRLVEDDRRLADWATPLLG